MGVSLSERHAFFLLGRVASFAFSKGRRFSDTFSVLAFRIWVFQPWRPTLALSRCSTAVFSSFAPVLSTKKLPITSTSIFVRRKQSSASSGRQTTGSFSLKEVLRTRKAGKTVEFFCQNRLDLPEVAQSLEGMIEPFRMNESSRWGHPNCPNRVPQRRVTRVREPRLSDGSRPSAESEPTRRSQ
jgi:hypothetical protein